MLTILFGVSGVGKSTLIRELRYQFGWLSIPTYMTRLLRPGETEKISISDTDFVRMENENLFVCVNHIFGNKYGTPRKEIEIAVQDQGSYWMHDFPISRMNLLGDYKYLGFVILPQNEDQLIEQVKISNRTERLKFILQEYREHYVRYHNRAQDNASLISVVNAPNRLNETSRLIYSIAAKSNV